MHDFIGITVICEFGIMKLTAELRQGKMGERKNATEKSRRKKRTEPVKIVTPEMFCFSVKQPKTTKTVIKKAKKHCVVNTDNNTHTIA